MWPIEVLRSITQIEPRFPFKARVEACNAKCLEMTGSMAIFYKLSKNPMFSIKYYPRATQTRRNAGSSCSDLKDLTFSTSQLSSKAQRLYVSHTIHFRDCLQNVWSVVYCESQGRNQKVCPYFRRVPAGKWLCSKCCNIPLTQHSLSALLWTQELPVSLEENWKTQLLSLLWHSGHVA